MPRLSVCVLSFVLSAAQLEDYTKNQRAVLPWLTPLGRAGAGCGNDNPADPVCNLTQIALACSGDAVHASHLRLLPGAGRTATPNCTWSALLPNEYISGCAQPPGRKTPAVNCIHFDAVDDAKAACAADVNCFGLTSQPGGVGPWELRANPAAQPSPTGESAYQITNPFECHPQPPQAGCNAFDSNGFLYHCPGGYCDCDSGQAYCMRGRDIFSADPAVGLGANNTDLWVRAGLPVPPEWAAGAAAASLLFAAPEPNVCYLPEVGNGYLATVPAWGSLHVAGLFNGACGSTHKARLPSPVAISLSAVGANNVTAAVVAAALDMEAASYTRRWSLGDASGAQVDVRVWAHRTRKHLLVADVTLVAGSAAAATFTVSSLWDPAGQRTDVPGDGCAGGFTVDFAWDGGAGAAPAVFSGVTTLASDVGFHPAVAVALDPAPAAPVTLTTAAPTLRLLVAVAASLDFPGGEGTPAQVAALAAAAYAEAAGNASLLWAEHVAGWAVLHAAGGIDVAPAAGDDAGAAARAHDVAAHVNASRYFLYSSLRADAYAGISPGGLATENYQGAVFMDADWWMEPPLYLLAPGLAAAVLQYRFLSLPVMRQLAVTFGYGAYGGAMAAWTAAYAGNAFGCCSGHGAYEDCLEQHVTGDIAFSAWQYYAATGDKAWLAAVGWPILQGAADFHLARVSPPPPAAAADVPADAAFHVTGVLPIDEWCVGAGCGCETPGVDDDAQMNAVTKASLLLAAAAARELGTVTQRSLLWDAVGGAVVLLMNASRGHHDQFTSPGCPDGWGGGHYAPSHTVCPEDVLLLTYPLGDLLNASDAVSRADAELFIPLTCRENAGMTTPMHTIVWLALGEVGKAQAEFNRTLHAACYGPFLVRNEVDKHADIPGGHFDNTHFLTGDGGALQAVLYGWGGLRIAPAGGRLRLLQPHLPEAVGALTLRALAWRGGHVTVAIEAGAQTVAVLDGPSPLCLTDARGGVLELAAGGAPAVLQNATYAYPATLAAC